MARLSVRLFDGVPSDQVELECKRVLSSQAATHLKYDVVT